MDALQAMTHNKCVFTLQLKFRLHKTFDGEGKIRAVEPVMELIFVHSTYVAYLSFFWISQVVHKLTIFRMRYKTVKCYQIRNLCCEAKYQTCRNN
jgi:hypothetical protein